MPRPGRRPLVATASLTAFVLAAALAMAGPGEPAGPVATLRASRPAPTPVPGRQQLVRLLTDHVVRAAPDAGAARIARVAARRPLTHVRTALPVLGRAGAWVHVRLPGRPNGHAGWISADGTRRTFTDWQIAVHLSSRLVKVYRRGRLQGQFRAVVGTHSTPTPRGHFFVEEGVPLQQLGAPYALAVSARSSVYQHFGGGPGQIALHGTTGLAAAPGTAASHGCLRLSPRAMAWLRARIRAGVPLTIR